MADAMQELESAVALVEIGLAELARKHPDHELLRYRGVWDRIYLPDDFLARFGDGKPRSEVQGSFFTRAGLYANFHTALEKAVRTEVEGQVVVRGAFEGEEVHPSLAHSDGWQRERIRVPAGARGVIRALQAPGRKDRLAVQFPDIASGNMGSVAGGVLVETALDSLDLAS